MHEVLQHRFRIAVLEQRTVATLADTAHEQWQLRPQPHRNTVLSDGDPRFLVHESAAPCRQHLWPRAQQPGEHLALAFAEIRLSVVGEDILYVLARRLLDLLVGIDKWQASLAARRRPMADLPHPMSPTSTTDRCPRAVRIAFSDWASGIFFLFRSRPNRRMTMIICVSSPTAHFTAAGAENCPRRLRRLLWIVTERKS